MMRTHMPAVVDPSATPLQSGVVHLLTFSLAGQRYALLASAVERVTWMVRLTPLPAAPRIVLGVIDLQGSIVPVVDTRSRFGLPPRQVSPADRLVFARTSRRRLALVVDDVDEVLEYPEDRIRHADDIVPGTHYLLGVAKLDDSLVLIHDLDTFLALGEERTLEEALQQRTTGVDRTDSRTDGGRGDAEVPDEE
jgi:purine-binding chemotaxis protein CheW